MFGNRILLTDSYKVSHWKQYPPRTQGVYSFFESRGGDYPEVMLFGLQYILQEHLAGMVLIREEIDEAEQLFAKHFGQDIFNRKGWEHILDKHDGMLPVRIWAVPEGNSYPVRTPLIAIENTDPEVPWLTNYLETLLSQVWYPSTVATQSRSMKRDILEALKKSGDPSGIDFKLHDFGFRGSTSVESSAIGGAAHLVNFKGTDTLSAITLLQDFYDAEMAGHSVPAAEHSTITSWGKAREREAFANMLEKFPSGLVAVVSDSYDIYNACSNLWYELRDKVYSRDGVLIVRPDSGYPPDIVIEVLKRLAGSFSYHVNAKGYKVLDDKVRVIQGDGIDPAMLKLILKRLLDEGWSADNLAFGSGGGLIQKLNRDTCKFAFKCCAIKLESSAEWIPVSKDPVTDSGKASRGGRLTSPDMRLVFENGNILINDDLETIRKRAVIE